MNTDRFKFRVWDKTVNRYFQDEEFCINCFGSLVIQSEFDGDSLRDMDDFIIEQCTGIRDKNGKLIYEGDIVSINHSSKSQVKCIVEWGCGLTGYYCTSIKGYQDWNLASSDGPYIEIIGNIHEKEGAK